jgi:DNA-binding MarR family transcriptional regulator
MESPVTSACPSGDERVRLFGLLLETNARLARCVGSQLESGAGLPLAWFDVLLQLRLAPEGHLRMSEIAEATVHSTGGTTRLIDRIEEAGYVTRADCPSDRRAVHVMITPAGDAKLDEALAVHVAHLEGHVGARLTPDERATLSDLLTKLNREG